MKKQAIPMKVKNLYKMYERDNLTFNNPIQRRCEQWKNYQKSLLIHSILDDYIIPPIYLIKEDKGSVDVRGRAISDYDVLDGKQRLTTVFNFIDDKFALSDLTPSIELDEEEYELAGKKFSELDSELQENINNFGFSIYNLEGNSDEEVEEFFLRINGGESLSKNQNTKAKIGVKTMETINKFLDSWFFSHICNFSGEQYKNEVDLCALLQCMMMIDVNAGRYEFSSFSENDAQDYGESLHDGINIETEETVKKVLDYLDDVFDGVTSKEKWLRKTHIPMVFLTAQKAIERGIDADTFYDWYSVFAYCYYNPECEYAQFCGAGSVKKFKVFGRIETMFNHFDQWVSENLLEENGEIVFDDSDDANEEFEIHDDWSAA